MDYIQVSKRKHGAVDLDYSGLSIKFCSLGFSERGRSTRMPCIPDPSEP
jgi:hypothetical protein